MSKSWRDRIYHFINHLISGGGKSKHYYREEDIPKDVRDNARRASLRYGVYRKCSAMIKWYQRKTDRAQGKKAFRQELNQDVIAEFEAGGLGASYGEKGDAD
jgi:hypothetical protein